MRVLAALTLGAVLGSCTTSPEPYHPTAQAQAQLARLLAGKTGGPPVSCIPSYNTGDMEIVDGRNVAFKRGQQSVYMAHLSPGCQLLGWGNYALLTKQFGGTGLCRGDIAQVLDTSSRTVVGSCVVEAIVPYNAQR